MEGRNPLFYVENVQPKKKEQKRAPSTPDWSDHERSLRPDHIQSALDSFLKLKMATILVAAWDYTTWRASWPTSM